MPATLAYSDDLNTFLYYHKLESEIARMLHDQVAYGAVTRDQYGYPMREVVHQYTKPGFANYLDVDYGSMHVSFLPAGKDETEWRVLYSSPSRQSMKPGRLARAVLSQEALSELSASDFETFSNAFKAYCEKNRATIDLVCGEDIANWYGAESLGVSSCMQGGPEEWFDLYTHNPDRVSLLVAVNGHNELIGRGLVWTLENGDRYIDTIYGSDHVRRLLEQEASARGFTRDYGRGFVPLSQTDFDSFPYLDSFRYLIPGKGLSVDQVDGATRYLTSTGGWAYWLCAECGDSSDYEMEEQDDGSILCGGCVHRRFCSHCGDEKEDHDEDYCDTCLSTYLCTACGDFETRGNEGGYCRWCKEQHRCEGCGNVDESVETRYSMDSAWGRESHPGYCDSCRPDHTCERCLRVLGPDEALTDDLCDACAAASEESDEVEPSPTLTSQDATDTSTAHVELASHIRLARMLTTT